MGKLIKKLPDSPGIWKLYQDNLVNLVMVVVKDGKAILVDKDDGHVSTTVLAKPGVWVKV